MLYKIKDKTLARVIAMEEMAELQKAISKDIRGLGSKQQLTECVADAILAIMTVTDVCDINLNNLMDQIKFKHMRNAMRDEDEWAK